MPRRISNPNQADQHEIINQQASLESKHRLCIFQQNLQSTRNKVTNIETFLSLNKNVHVLCFSEIWLESSELEFYKFENYCIGEAFCRSSKDGGGVSIYIKSKIKFKILEDIKKLSIESHLK